MNEDEPTSKKVVQTVRIDFQGINEYALKALIERMPGDFFSGTIEAVKTQADLDREEALAAEYRTRQAAEKARQAVTNLEVGRG